MKSNPKKEIVTTAIAAVAALAIAGTSAGLYYTSQPVAPDQYAKVSQVFFENFDSAQQIAMMKLTAVGEDGVPQTFELEKKNGIWTIPTHYDYPAEAGQRLSETATALQGLVRVRLANAAKGAQENLGVLDPTSDSGKENPESAGKLIQFRDSNDEVLFDLIVGKKVEKDQNVSVYDSAEPAEEKNNYYVRVPSEIETYVAELDLDISTKFSDWISKDLLEISTNQLRKLELNNYRLESRNVLSNGGITVQRQMVHEGDLTLTKSSASDPWTVTDLAANQQVDSTKVDEVLEAIESLELQGVRPQYSYKGESLLDEDLQLSLPESLQNNQQAAIEALEEMQTELINAGFALAQDPQTGKARLVAEFGEMKATSDQGITYTLLYGAEVKGEGDNIEIGTDRPETNANADSNESQDSKDGRLVMIRVNFDASAVEGKPIEPVAPEKLTLPANFGVPETTNPAEPAFDAPPVPNATNSQDPDNSTSTDEDTSATKVTGGDDDGDSTSQIPENGTPQEQEESQSAGLFNIQEPDVGETATLNQQPATTGEDIRAQAQLQLDQQYQMQMQQFQQQQQVYEGQVKDYETKVAEAKQKAERLKQRFANWYYVVPNSDLEALRMKREDVIKVKDPIDESGAIQNPIGLPPGFDPSMLQQRR